MSNIENVVRERYTQGASEVEPGLCCPTTYDPQFLKAIPDEVLKRDYGCGDPTRHLKPGETVVDLGSGSGKICFIASQVVGAAGRVIGVDVNDDMLRVAQRYAPEVARRVGYSNVEFRKGKVQDLALDLEALDAWLQAHPVRSAADLPPFEQMMEELRRSRPLLPGDSVDVVISSCVLNLVRPEDRQKLFAEIFRVLRRGGRAVISDIVSDEDVPEELQSNPELWSGCVSGAFREDLFLKAFEEAGFCGISLLERQERPWRAVEGIEFRSVTVVAYKGKEGACWDRKQAVIYRGPFRQVEDDDGHVLRRGVRVAVCEKTFHIYSRHPYRSHFDFVEPRVPVEPHDVRPFPCAKGMLVRHPRETKGEDYRLTTEATEACCSGNGNGPKGACC